MVARVVALGVVSSALTMRACVALGAVVGLVVGAGVVLSLGLGVGGLGLVGVTVVVGLVGVGSLLVVNIVPVTFVVT